MTKTLPQPERGFQPARDEHGYALSDIKDPAGASDRAAVGAALREAAPPPAPATGSLPAGPPPPLPPQVGTFAAWRKDTGEQITVDARTFDGATVSREPVEVPSA